MKKAVTRWDPQTQQMSQHLAAHLKAMRILKGWSLDATAAQCGVSKAMLGQIERGESSPTIATLWKIASGLQTSFSAFLTPPSAITPDAHFPNDPNMHVKTLFNFASDVAMEIFEISLKQGHSQLSDPHQQGVIEHVIVIRGVMEVWVEGTWQRLCTSDALRFNADKPHGYRALDEAAVFHNMVCYPRSSL
jgi:transcriptional regulator with XRE-family HTH domain